MRGELIAVGELQDDPGYFCRIAGLISPIGFVGVGEGADRRFIVREQLGRILVRAVAPVGAYAAGFKRAEFDAEGRDFLSERFGESSHRPFGGVVGRVAGASDAAADGRYL